MCMGGLLRCCQQPGSLLYPVKWSPPNQPEQFIIPLTGAFAEVEILDTIAKITIKQRYENKESSPIEAVYEFPLEPKAAVCDFWAEIGDKKIIGKIKEKEEAKDIYDDAIASGNGAYLLEETKPSQFSASVGNLPPNEEVMLVIVYVTELEFDEGKLKLVLPSLPYPPDGKNVRKFEVPSKSDGKYNKQISYGLKIDISLNMTSNIKSVASPSHPIQFEFGDSPKNAKVTLSNPDGTPLIKDFELLVSLADPHLPCARIQKDNEKNQAVMFSLYPKMDEDQVFTEMIFLVDRSGSMSGLVGSGFKTRIEQVKETLQIFLRSIPEGTLFNIVSFGTTFTKLFSSSKEYNEKTLNEASAHVDRMSADMGGTNISNPLLAILKEKQKEGIPRQLFLLTDGEVSNADECIKIVRSHSHAARVFTFGIGMEASKYLVAGMAKAGEGKFEIIKPGDNMDEKVMRQLNHALKPAITNIKIDWGDLKVEKQTPFHIPPVFSGSRLLVFGYLPDKFKIQISGKTSIGNFKSQVSIDLKEESNKGDIITKLAARSMIRDLEEGRSYMHEESGKFKKGKDESSKKKEILNLSLQSGIVSSLTAFVAVEKRENATEGEMKLRKIDVEDIMNSDKRKVGGYGARGYGGGGGGVRGGSFGRGGSRGGVGSRGGGAPPMMLKSKSLLKPSSLSRNGPPPPGSAPPPSRSAPPPAPGSVRASSSVAPMRQRASSVEKKGAIRKESSAKMEMEESKQIFAEKEMEMRMDEEESESLQESLQLASESKDEKMEFKESFASPALASPQSTTPTDNSDLMRRIIKTQKANGSFTYESLALITKAGKEEIKKVLSEISVEANENNELLLITAVICAYFATKFADLKTNWNLVVKKSQSLLKKESKVDWEQASNIFLKNNNII